MTLPLPRLLLALPLLAACAAPSAPPPMPPAPQVVAVGMAEGVRLIVEPLVAAPGGEVTLTLINERREEVGYNLCMAALARIENGRWISLRQDAACTRELRIVAPGGRAFYARRLPATLAPGRYGFSTRVEAPLRGSRHPRPVMSNPFELR
jgi:hypothetical protein